MPTTIAGGRTGLPTDQECDPPRENSIAVLPFTDMSADRDQAFLCDGMSEEIINALGQVSDVRVA